MDSVIADLVTLASVALIDLTLAGDNAVVVGLAASRVPREERRRVIFVGIALALLFRIAFAFVAVELLSIIGLLLAGGLLLLWVGWKLARELPARAVPEPGSADPPASVAVKHPTVAILQIAAADISMSLDNVLAVAGAARHSMVMLAFGLALSVALMGVAATLVAGVLHRFPWLSYLGLAIIAVVALRMIYEGGIQVLTALAGA